MYAVIVSAWDLETALRDQLKGRFRVASQLHMADKEYWATPLHDVVDLIKREKIYDLAYLDEVHDCDDFAHNLSDAMIRSCWKNRRRVRPHAFGEIWGRVPGGGHAINVMLNSDGAVRLVEPQRNTGIMTPDECDISEIWMIRI